jgi:hypothetical protein
LSKKHGSTSEAAKAYRQAGHDNAKSFALKIGMQADYQNDAKAKKDVIGSQAYNSQRHFLKTTTSLEKKNDL